MTIIQKGEPMRLIKDTIYAYGREDEAREILGYVLDILGG